MPGKLREVLMKWAARRETRESTGAFGQAPIDDAGQPNDLRVLFFEMWVCRRR